ncbi:hypothetical protein BU23DRAFT_57755 [Bimuria novae-zelandiae CBS 107.79]|uniref:Uncharacterized protein n=1 Tax=Bimuria novae-zelandiae CBS 107.79 TaxID=1447943 RepID=A0A6A5VGX8_9PLEO|nr:hypothetical protein BU23DRAFT_57755 [Bimuria novae-zelandiae CBS 107.79]
MLSIILIGKKRKFQRRCLPFCASCLEKRWRESWIRIVMVSRSESRLCACGACACTCSGGGINHSRACEKCWRTWGLTSWIQSLIQTIPSTFYLKTQRLYRSFGLGLPAGCKIVYVDNSISVSYSKHVVFYLQLTVYHAR